LKFEMIGVSMISPEGLVIRPRMPASCFICVVDPRAPECAIIHTEFTGRPGLGVEMPFIISFGHASEQRDQASNHLVVLLAEVIRPSWYCCSYSLTSF